MKHFLYLLSMAALISSCGNQQAEADSSSNCKNLEEITLDEFTAVGIDYCHDLEDYEVVLSQKNNNDDLGCFEGKCYKVRTADYNVDKITQCGDGRNVYRYTKLKIDSDDSTFVNLDPIGIFKQGAVLDGLKQAYKGWKWTGRGGNSQVGYYDPAIYIYPDGSYYLQTRVEVAHKCGSLQLTFEFKDASGHTVAPVVIGRRFDAGIIYTEPLRGHSEAIENHYSSIVAVENSRATWTQYSSCRR